MRDCFIVLLAVGISFPLGVMILIFPLGPVKWVLKKTASMYLRDPRSRENLSRVRPYPGAHFTLLEWYEALAEDPVQAIDKYEPWLFWVDFVVGTIWLLATARVALVIKPVCGPVVQSLLHGLLR